jgi:Leucine-rich repeat (LRR) protein
VTYSNISSLTSSSSVIPASLHHLNLSHNLIKSLNKIFLPEGSILSNGSNKSSSLLLLLEVIDLSHNKITELPVDIFLLGGGGGGSLKSLFLRGKSINTNSL